ncbi:two-component regulator propeller domain-containing protein, partial [Candidatus Latescibacterota bacterium]
AGCGESTLDSIDADSGGSVVVLDTADGLADITVTDIAVDYVFNGVWIGTRNGISFYSKADSTIFTYGAEYTGIPDMEITSILVDNSGTVWAGTEKGAAYLAPGDPLWVNISSLHGWYVTDIAAANDYSIYFATRNGLKVKSAQGTWATLYDDLGPSTDISSLAIGTAGAVWAGTTNGISVFDPMSGNWIQYGASVLTTSTYVNTIYKDTSGSMWCGTASIVAKYTGTSWVNYGAADGLSASGINDFAEDNFGIVWAATDMGVFFFVENKWYPYDLPDEVAGSIVSTVEVDNKTGDMWIGTSSGAVLIYNSAD